MQERVLPTQKQALACVQVCQMLSNSYLDITLFRFDENRKEVYILAGKELQIIVYQNGEWEFVDET